MTLAVNTKFDVGGVMLDRPFKIRRLGHFGFNVVNMEEGRRFYVDLLGFKVSDVMTRFNEMLTPEQLKEVGDARGYFTRYGGDHHAFVLFNKKVMDLLGRKARRPDVTINQITWQVGSLKEVNDAATWLPEQGAELQRVGRDMPGSNWHSYVYDNTGHTNELYYGIEQIGWQGYSKPRDMYYRGFREAPQLPQMNEFQEVQEALSKGISVTSGYRHVDELADEFDVDGVMLPRPFKITKIGPVSLFVEDFDQAISYYSDVLGFTETERTTLNGQTGVFMRCNTEHHSIALFPMAAREALGFSPHTTCMAFGVQLANYRQLKDAVTFLREEGIRVETDVPAELHPGMDYVAHAFDADGHCVQMYANMEQVGWDGQPRPASMRPQVDNAAWPETLEPTSDTYTGEVFQGPWG
jgi:catechol 2,3-dioxygenase-like lactoylglutathione lyase family enzyme